MRRRFGVALSFAVLLAGCVTGADIPAQNTEDPLALYLDQEVEWSDCGAGAECATVLAPLDWDNPGVGDDVNLALSRHSATGQALGSLFVNPGGPGASGYEFVLDSVDFAVSEALRESFDVIGWDPRV